MAKRSNSAIEVSPNNPKAPIRSVQTFSTAKDASVSPIPSRHLSNPNESNNGEPPSADEDEDNDVLSGFQNTHPGILLLLIFVGYIFLLYCAYLLFPTMEPHERKHIKLPWNMQEAKNLAKVLDKYTDKNYYSVLLSFGFVYLFLQTFAIPGSIFLSIMSGFLFPFWTALFLVCFCSASGASSCYLLSWLVGRPLVRAHFLPTVRHWREKVNEERDNLLNFMIFIRITPILPNWLVNIVAPHIGVPLSVFWVGTFIGVAPPSVLAVQAGRTLNMMTSPTDQFSWTSIIVLGIIAVGSLVPVLVRRWSH